MPKAVNGFQLDKAIVMVFIIVILNGLHNVIAMTVVAYNRFQFKISHGIVIVILNVIVVPPIIVMAIKRGESPLALSSSSVDGFHPIKSGPLLLLRRARFQLRLLGPILGTHRYHRWTHDPELRQIGHKKLRWTKSPKSTNCLNKFSIKQPN